MNDAEALKRYLAEEMVEDYEEGRMSRREMVRRVGLILGVSTVGPALLAALGCSTPGPGGPDRAPVPPGKTDGVTVKPDDPALTAGPVEFPGDAGPVRGYHARPQGQGPFSGVVVIHENRGLTEHHKDVARRLARVGYAALAVDLVSRQGGTEQFPDAGAVTGALGQSKPEELIADLRAGVKWLQGQPHVQQGKVGAVGWCFGGGMAWRLATAEPQVGAAVAYYGPNPPLEAVPNIQGAVLGIYGGNDRRITDGKAALAEALQKAGKTFDMQVYDGADHAFFNDTGTRFSPEAAKDAWARTLDWFARHLKA